MSAPAYYFADMTFCEPCAFRPTAMGMILAGQGVPENMEDAIAQMMLSQISAGLPVDVPVAVTAHGVCENCGAEYGAPAPQDAA